MATDLSTTLTAEPVCDHSDLDIHQRLARQGNGFMLHVDQVKCKNCGEIMVSPAGKGKYLSKTKLILIPRSLTDQTTQTEAPPYDACNPEKGCPGNEMLALTAELGIETKPGCSCKSTAATMDRLGVDGCRTRINELTLSVAANWASWGWQDKLTSVAKSAWKAAGLGVKPTDPIRNLLELAIERADQKRVTQ